MFAGHTSVLFPELHELDVQQSQRIQALGCFERLFESTRGQFAENAKLKIPVLNSVMHNPLNDSEIVLFVAFDREGNMHHKENRVYRDGTYWCDDDRKVSARVVRHDRKFWPQLKMYCPVSTTTLVFETEDPALKSKLMFDLRPYLACDGQDLLPPNTVAAEHQKPYVAACTTVKGAEMYDLLPQWIEYHRMIGIETFWIHIDDKMDRFYRQAPDVWLYFQRPDVQRYTALLPYEWAGDDTAPFFVREYWKYHRFVLNYDSRCFGISFSNH